MIKGTSPYTIERLLMPASGTDGLYFHYTFTGGKVDTLLFKIEYSHGRIREDEVMSLVNKVKNCPFPEDVTYSSVCWLPLTTFMVVGAGIPLFLLAFKTNLTAPGVKLGLGLIYGPGAALFLAIICMNDCGDSKNRTLRAKTISAIMQKHQSQVFGPKQ